MSDITIVVDCNDADFARDICAALQQFPDVTALLPHHQAARDAQYASCWFPDPQLLTRSPGLKLIQAASAGVDHLPPALFASEIPLCRVIDEDFRHGMFEYALWSVLWFQRHFDRALAHQRTQTWKLYPQRAAADFHIGIMGLGEIGGYIADQLARLGFSVDCLHGDLSQKERNQIMQNFRDGKLAILVATDVAARGIDVSDVDAVINYDVPGDNEHYTHRIGRTGRAKKEGVSYLFYVPEEKKRVQELLRLTRNTDLCTPVHFDFNHERIVVEKQADHADRFQIKCYF